MQVDFHKAFPIHSIEDNFLISGNGDVTAGFALKMPEVFTMGTSEHNSIHESFVSLLKLLPPKTIFHKLDYVFVSKYSSIEDFETHYTFSRNMRSWHEKPVTEHYSYVFISFPASSKYAKNSYLTLPDFIFSKPFDLLPELKDKIENYCNTFFNGLNAIQGFQAIRMNNKKLGAVLYDYFNQTYNSPVIEYNDKLIQPYKIENDALKIGNKYVSVMSLIEEGAGLANIKAPKTSPGNVYDNGVEYNNAIDTPTSFVYPLCLGLPIDHIYSTIIEIMDNDVALAELSAQSNTYNSTASIGHGASIAKKNSIQLFKNTIEQYNYQITKTAVNVILLNKDKDKMQKNIGLVETAFQNMNGSRIFIENLENTSLFFACSPGNSRVNNRRFMNVLNQAVCYLNKETHYYSDKKGHVFIDRFGKPVIVNMWDSPHIVNRNKVIFGPSGSGKSFLINNLIDQCIAQKNHVVIIDIGHSYKRTCKINNGLYFDSSDKSKLSFNIFLCEKDKNGKYIYKSTDEAEDANAQIDFVYSVLSWIWKEGDKITTESKRIIKQSIASFYDYVNTNSLFPDMNLYYNFTYEFEKTIIESNKKYMDFDSLRLMLEPYVKDGEYKLLLNSKENLNITNEPFVVFDLEDINGKKELFNVCSLIITNLVIEKIKRLKSVRKDFIIDEALDFLKSDMGDFIAYLYRTFRKKEGAVYLAAQNVAFLKACSEEIRNSININTDTKILLDHSNYKSSYKDLSEILSLTKHDILQLDSIKNGSNYREFFLKMGNHTRILRNQVSDETAAVYTSKASEVAEIERLFEELGSMTAALDTFVQNKYLKI